MAWGNYYGFRPYVSVAERRRNAEREVANLAKKGRIIRPIQSVFGVCQAKLECGSRSHRNSE